MSFSPVGRVTDALSQSQAYRSHNDRQKQKKKKKEPASVHGVRGRRSLVWLFRVFVYSPVHKRYKTCSCPRSSLPRRVGLTRCCYYCSRRLYNQTFYTMLSFHFLKQKKLAKIEIRGPPGDPLENQGSSEPQEDEEEGGREDHHGLESNKYIGRAYYSCEL